MLISYILFTFRLPLPSSGALYFLYYHSKVRYRKRNELLFSKEDALN